MSDEKTILVNEAYENLKRHYPQGIPFCVKFAIDKAIAKAREEARLEFNKMISIIEDKAKQEEKRRLLNKLIRLYKNCRNKEIPIKMLLNDLKEEKSSRGD